SASVRGKRTILSGLQKSLMILISLLPTSSKTNILETLPIGGYQIAARSKECCAAQDSKSLAIPKTKPGSAGPENCATDNTSLTLKCRVSCKDLGRVHGRSSNALE